MKPILLTKMAVAISLPFLLLLAITGWAADANQPLGEVRDAAEKPYVAERGVSIYTMRQAYFESRFFNEDYWARYFDMLARNRFNTFVLIFGYENAEYFAPAYPYFFDVEGFPDVRVVDLTKEQQERNLKTLNRLIEMARERGIDFTTGLWDHIYRGGVQSGGVKDADPGKPRSGIVIGLTEKDLMAYHKAALAKFLKLAPGLHAVQFRMHGESGLKKEEMPAFWQGIYQVMKEHGPNVIFDARVKDFPDSLIDLALDMGVKFRLNTKYWAEQRETPYVIVRLRQESVQNRADGAPARASFLKLIDRPRAPLTPEVKELGEVDGLAQTHFTFAADAEQRAPGILVKQAKSAGRRPVVIALHGTGGNKEGQLPLLKELAGQGFIGVAIDGRYHGERSKAGKGSAEYVDAILRAYRTGKERPFLYDTVWDVMRLIDYLETREDVDPKRIGVIGFSKGGMETYLAAAVDPRVAVAVPCIGVQSFRWALENNAWKSRVETFQAAINGAAKDAGVAEINADFVSKFYDRLVPGVYAQFDGPEMLPLIASRPLLVINGDSDPRTPLPGVMECAKRARQTYANARAEDKFQLLIQEKTGHAVTPAARQAAIAWFVKWLKP